MSDTVLKSSAPVSCGRIDGNRIRLAGHLFSGMKALCRLICAVAAFLAMNGRADAAPYDSITSYMVKENGTSNVLMSKDVDQQVSPASLTKVLTCIMAIESGHLDDEVVVTKESTLVEPTKAGLREGDRIQLRDLVKAAMVNSSNDAAFAIAIHLGGSVEGFARSMNSRARSLGMASSHFTNPAGFDFAPWVGNRTTARDLMVLTEHAVRNSEFNAIARLERANFKEIATGRPFSLKTHNKMFELYPYTVGIKTGFTNHAGKCLIARAVRERKDVLLVMLNAKGDRWGMAADMFDQGLGIAPGERVSTPVAAKRYSERGNPVSAREVARNREKALAALRMQVARNGRPEAAGIKAAKGVNRKADRQQRLADERHDQKMQKHAAYDRKLALKASHGRPAQSKAALRSGRRQQEEKRLALKPGKGANARPAAPAKAGRKGRADSRAAVNQKRRGAEVTKLTKQKHRREALSSAAPAAFASARSCVG